LMQQQAHSSPLPLVCVSAPEDAALLGHWETHLRLLEQAGLISIWSELHLAAGVSREQEYRQHIKDAGLILLLLSADFFASSDCLAMMEQALERANEGIAQVIPLLLRPVAWQASSLRELVSWPSNGMPITQWTNEDMAWDACLQSLRHLLGHRVSEALSPERPQKQTRRAILKWGGIGLTATLTTSGLFYWFRHLSLPSSQHSLSSPGSVYTYSTPTGIGVYDVGWSPNGDFIACVDGNNAVQVITVLPNGYYPSQTGFAVYCLTWSPDGVQLASPGPDKKIHIWDPLNGVDALSFPYSITPECITWSHNGKRIAVCSNDGIVVTWDAITGRPLLTYNGHRGIVWWADWSPDNTRLATAGDDGLVRIWNVTTGKILLTYTGHAQAVAVQDVKWSPSGKSIVSASKDKTVRVWDAQTGKTNYVYRKHNKSVQCAEWSPNEEFIASGSADTTIHVWDALTGKNSMSYYGHTNTVWTLAWSPNGHYLASSSKDGTMRVWPYR
jgi:hypothetical protein